MVLYEKTRHLLHWKEGMDHNLLNVAEEPVYHIHSDLDGAERVVIWLQVPAGVGGKGLRMLQVAWGLGAQKGHCKN